MRTISILDIKQAMRDQRFRDSLPSSMHEDIQKYLKNPTCKCNHPIYVRIATECKDQLKSYFPNKKEPNVEKELEDLAKNTFSVINCNIKDLEKELKKLPPGRKQIEAARWEDQVTVIVNELDLIY